MAEFKLDRFKYVWKGDWITGTNYRRDDIVRVGGKSYVCIVTHTSSGTFLTDLEATLPNSSPPQPYPQWTVMTSGKTFIGTWSQGVAYNLGDIVLYNGSLYKCIDSHNSGNFASEYSNWEMFAYAQEFLTDWAPTTTYGKGGIVKYNGIVYICHIPHTSSSLLENNINDWLEFGNGIEYKSSWSAGVEYRKNDLIRYGANIFRCTDSHTSAGLVFDQTKFQIEFPGTQANLTVWQDDTYYQEGDVVRYGGFIYFATANSIDVDPSRSQDDSTVAWIVLAKNSSFAGEFVSGTAYKTGELVLRGGYLYRALTDVNIVDGEDSTVDYLDNSIWEKVAEGNKWSEVWKENTNYAVGEVVYFKGSAYVCTFEHDATQRDNPENGSGYSYWDLLIQAGRPAGMDTKGDLLTYNTLDDGSSQGDIGLSIGKDQQALSVAEDYEAFWRDFANDAEAVYVAPKGFDLPGYGKNWKQPFATIRHACEYIEDTFPALTPTKIFVAAGRYEEVGPIAVPAGCVVMGDELRATNIIATPAIPEYEDNYQYVKETDTYISGFILDLIQNKLLTPTTGNEEPQVLVGPVSDQPTAQRILELIAEYEQFIEFRLPDESGDVDPAQTTVANDLTSNSAFRAASQQLMANREFIGNEVYTRLTLNFPSITFTKKYILADVRAMLRGIAQDLLYEGNHRTLYAARRYTNSALGGQFDDLFYMRDTTGLRNCSTEGLTGTLNPPGVFDLYQRPTGGALVSLDPGWGPADERTWIKNRSPYIQGVTNFGFACAGMKVDGNLHNGGNKSMVANDFTQVLSDGVGAWITNNARAELVSVFTYYCSVGYLSENGGIIRATNGNNSYGRFGSIASGGDTTEVPQSTTLMNRNNEAQVSKVFSGLSDDRILAYEFSHTGEKYSSATSTVTGAGSSVVTEFRDFRAGALYQARLVNTQGSGSEGGSNYLVRQGYAQETVNAASTLKLSTTDATQFYSEIEGMRVVILSGLGAGQYAYITAYNSATREATLSKDSDGTLGWDHIIPGTPLVSALDATTYYRIEPRVIASSPGWTSENKTIERLDYVSADFGGTSQLYPSLDGQVGTGETFGLDPIGSTWRVQRSGNTYTLTLVTGGAGYAVNDTITLSGTDLGGASPANDITIRVASVTDDSSNSVATFTYSGEPVGGLFVAIDDKSQAAYSADGNTWVQVNLSFDAGTDEYIKILAEENKFLAFATGMNTYSYSETATSWTTRALPITRNWNDAAFGGGTFVLVASGTADALYSTDGLTFSQSVLPQTDDWAAVQYGQGTFVAVTSGATQDVATSPDGITWTLRNAVLPAGSKTWTNVLFGKNRFVAIATDGTTAFSLDKGVTWTAGGSCNQSGSFVVKNGIYAEGVFMAVGWATTVGAGFTLEGYENALVSEDGINWTPQSLNLSYKWAAIAESPINGIPKFMVIAQDADGGLQHVTTGCKALVRADVNQGKFQDLLIWDPGSGYSDASPLTLTVTDTQFVSEVEFENRIGTGVLSQPDFVNRGGGYRITSTNVTIAGDGYADIVPEAAFMTLAGVTSIPGPGVQIKFEGLLEESTDDPDDLKLFSGIEITDLGDDGSGAGTRLVLFKVSPRLRNEYNLAHGTVVTLRERYSQCRISGHDFLDIGTGNFVATNYPDIYAGGAYYTAAPENEVLEQTGGRVFYVSTDQDGNFRTGELFSVQQATGIVTISAEFFDLDGLSELALGGVRLGGSGTVVNEFSTDPTFAADSNQVIPTQRAIASFLADRLSVGGENLETNAVQAGQVRVGTVNNVIEHASDGTIDIPIDVSIDGTYTSTDEFGVETTQQVAISGTIYTMQQLMKGHDDSVQ